MCIKFPSSYIVVVVESEASRRALDTCSEMSAYIGVYALELYVTVQQNIVANVSYTMSRNHRS